LNAQPQVISCSRRSDIPAFYCDWFFDRLAKGWVKVKNPLDRIQSRKVALTPDSVRWFVFWSRNYEHLLQPDALKRLEPYRCYFHFTILPRDRFIEPYDFDMEKAIDQAGRIIERFGADSLSWRYDPIVFYRQIGSREVRTNHEFDRFKYLFDALKRKGVNRLIVSIVDPYKKTEARLKKAGLALIAPHRAMIEDTLLPLADHANQGGMPIVSCNEEWEIFGIKKGSCIDGALLNKIANSSADRISEAPMPLRTSCLCTASIDIGDYKKHPCKHYCLYCYPS